MKKIIIHSILLSLCLSAYGQKQFTNSGNFKIYAGANITFFGDIVNNGALIDSGLVVTLASTAAQTISGSSVTTFNNLSINNTNASGVTLAQAVNTRGALTMIAGLLTTTSTNILTMQNGSTATVGSSASTSYVNGPMKYQKSTAGSTILNFPIGKGADCRPIAITVNHTGTALYNYQAESFNADAGALWYTLPATIDTVSGVHYWTVDRTDNTNAVQPTANLNGNQTIQIFFGNNDNVINGSTLAICKNANVSSTTWFDIGGTGGPAFNAGTNLVGSITSTSAPATFTSFSTFTLGNKIGGANPLPVEFLYFNAKPDESAVALNWATASEINNHHFEVERSVDGTLFEYVVPVKAYGNGNSIVTQKYGANDDKPYGGTSYYRLKQVDKNGAYKYSAVAQVNFNAKSFLSVYPNPTLNKLVVDVSENYLNASAKIIDVLGNELAVFSINSYGNQIDVTSLTSGIYYLIINIQSGNSNNYQDKIKILIQK